MTRDESHFTGWLLLLVAGIAWVVVDIWTSFRPEDEE